MWGGGVRTKYSEKIFGPVKDKVSDNLGYYTMTNFTVKIAKYRMACH
jgi:hypothetical protein